MRQHYFWSATATILLLACGKGEQKAVAAADTAGRDLQLAPVDTTARLSDVPAPADSMRPAAAPPETVVVYKKAPAAKPKPAVPAAAAGAQPAPAAAAGPKRELAAGATIHATVIDTITSARDSAGAARDSAGGLVRLRVAEPVLDAAGATVIPAGSTVTLKIQAIKWSENKNDKGTLRMSTENVLVDGSRYPLVGSVSTPAFTYKHRGSSLGDAAKVAGGAGAGAIVGGLIGKGTGAVIGGVVGGAVGAQRMSQTKDNDIFVVPGSPITITLTETFTR